MKKALIVSAICLLGLGLILAGLIYSWTRTPYGQLDLETAILVKMMPEPPPPGSISIEESREAARKLSAAGIPARYIRYDGVIHGFFGVPVFRKGRKALEDAAAALSEALFD